MQPEYGKAVIRVMKFPPRGVWKKEWYSIDVDCHGCWHHCGNYASTDDPKKVDMILEKQKSRILACQEWKSKPRLEIKYCKMQQLSISSFLGGKTLRKAWWEA